MIVYGAVAYAVAVLTISPDIRLKSVNLASVVRRVTVTVYGVSSESGSSEYKVHISLAVKLPSHTSLPLFEPWLSPSSIREATLLETMGKFDTPLKLVFLCIR